MDLHPPVGAVISAQSLDSDADTDANDYPRRRKAVLANIDGSGESSDGSLLLSPWLGESTESALTFSSILIRFPRYTSQFWWLTTLKLYASESYIMLPPDGSLKGVERAREQVPLLWISTNAVESATTLAGSQFRKALPGLFDNTFRSLVDSMRGLIKLSACHFSIRTLPPEVCYLEKLEELDLSFNKLNRLPDTISRLTELRSLRVANNRLLNLPSALSNLGMLEILDVSNNNLTSLASLQLSSMGSLHFLNTQNNKLLGCCGVPLRIWYSPDEKGDRNIRSAGNGILVNREGQSIHGYGHNYHMKYNGRCCLSQKPAKGSKGHDFLQEKARQERLNYSRNCKIDLLSQGTEIVCENMSCEIVTVDNDFGLLSSCRKQFDCVSYSDSHIAEVLADRSDSDVDHGDICTNDSSPVPVQYPVKGTSSEQFNASDCADSISCVTSESAVAYEDSSSNEVDSSDSSHCHAVEPSIPDASLCHMLRFSLPPKRRYAEDLDNPKPSKYARSVDDCSSISYKYCTESLCGIGDRLPDGFYDAGRDRPFMPVHRYDESISIDSREIILLDKASDEELDAVFLSARLLLSRFNNFNHPKDHNMINDFQRASLLALFVSDCFGGSDRSLQVAQMRKAVCGSNKLQPFVCTCSAPRSSCDSAIDQSLNYNFNDLCEQSLRVIKESQRSNVVPIGKLRFGVCRHRAVLMKYLCDRMDPTIPCELVRGYFDYMPHAWNVIAVKQGDARTRMVVDTCYPTDIREEIDREYLCRYIPLTRLLVPLAVDAPREHGCPFPSIPLYFCPGEVLHRYVKHCRLGSLDVAAKVKNLAMAVPEKDKRLFEYRFLGEVRMMGSLRNHSCIVEIYGHQISSKWGSSADRLEGTCGLQSVILMEYVKGGSLKGYLDKLVNAGQKHVPADLALYIARDIAWALVEVHSKHIIHRDVKSENVLIDLDRKKIDGSPIVKLSDFDNAVPLQSFLHTCCIRHYGVHPPNVCVGTPRWMAPEVFLAMNQRSLYGLEVDIWSYGCLIFELLTLQVPYDGLPDCEIYDLLQRRQRPRLTMELEELVLCKNDADTEKLKFLVELFHWCTQGNPTERPAAKQIYDMVCDFSPPIHCL